MDNETIQILLEEVGAIYNNIDSDLTSVRNIMHDNEDLFICYFMTRMFDIRDKIDEWYEALNDLFKKALVQNLNTVPITQMIHKFHILKIQLSNEFTKDVNLGIEQ